MSADGLPNARVELMPDQQAIRNACFEFFDGDVYRMAEELGYSPQSIYCWISGTRVPGRHVFERLSEVLHLDSFAALWVPDSSAMYFNGVRIGPDDKGFHEIRKRIAEALRKSDPDLAKRLRL